MLFSGLGWLEQAGIFPFVVEKYVKYEYALPPWFKAMLPKLFALLETVLALSCHRKADLSAGLDGLAIFTEATQHGVGYARSAARTAAAGLSRFSAGNLESRRSRRLRVVLRAAARGVCDCPFDEFVEALRRGILPLLHARSTDRKIYLADPPVECDAIMRWLRDNAAREEAVPGGLIEFEIPWDMAALEGTHPGIGTAYDRLAAAGLPRNAYFLMLYPLRVFDRQRWDSNVNSMPLLSKGVREFSWSSAPRGDAAPDESMKSSTISQLHEQLSDMREALCRLEANMANRNGGTIADVDEQQTPPPWAEGLEGLGVQLIAAAEQQQKLVGEIEAAKTGLAAVGQAVMTRLDEVSSTLVTQLQGVDRRVDETSTALGSQDHAFTQRLDEVATALGAHDDALTRRLDEVATALAAHDHSLAQRLDEVAAALAAQDQALGQRLDETGSSLLAQVQTLSMRLDEQIAVAQRATETNSALIQRFEGANTNLAARLQAVSQQLTAASAMWSATEEALDQRIAEAGRSLEAKTEAMAEQAGEARTASASLQSDVSAVRERLDAAVVTWEGGHQALELSLFSLRRELKDKGAAGEAVAGRLDGLGARVDAVAAAWQTQQAALERSLNGLVAELADDRSSAAVIAGRLATVETQCADDRGSAAVIADRLATVETRCADAEGWRDRIETDVARHRRAAEELGEELRAMQRNLEAAATWLLGELQQYQKKSRWGFLSRWFAGGR